MKTVTSLYLLLSLFFVTDATAQTFFEGAAGKSSINLPLGGIVRLNTTARNLKIGYYYNRSDKDIVFGVDASGQSNNGFAPLVSNKKISPEAEINFNLGVKNVTTSDLHPSGYDYLNIKVGVGEARYRLININAAFADQISTQTFTKINAGISYNYFLHGSMIFGGFAGYNRTNNISYLPQQTIKQTMPVATDATGTITRTAETEFTAWEGSLETVNQFSLFFDYVYIPALFGNRLAFSAYSRSRFNNIQSFTNGGLGLYLNRKGDPLKIVGGLIYEFDDLFDARNRGNSLADRGILGIVAGYNF